MSAGDIISLAGLTVATVANTIADTSITTPIQAQPIDPPTLVRYAEAAIKIGDLEGAIAALERVGTALPPPDATPEGVKPIPEILEAGKRLFVRIEDADLAALEPGKTVAVKAA